MRALCYFLEHKPAPHAVLLVGRALTRCIRCGTTIVSDGGPWTALSVRQHHRTEQILDMLAPD